VKLKIPVKDERIQWLVEKGNEVLILTRSEILKAPDEPRDFNAGEMHIPPMENYDDKVGLFRTIWVIHSGEIYGNIGKLIVDAIGLIVILLSITGALHFAMPYALRRLKKLKRHTVTAAATKRTSAKWHKKAGIWVAVFLLINTVTGMFLRPPLLITIASARVGKIPFSKLDTPNPWEDKLRAVIFDEEIGGYIIGTTEGLFYAREDFSRELVTLPGQPPLSVMGINVFQKSGNGTYLVGTFNGLFDWTPKDGYSRNHINGDLPGVYNSRSKPFGSEMVSGYWLLGSGNKAADGLGEIYFDYNKGAVSLDGNFRMPEMPAEIIEKSPMSLWNFALEVHTGRIFKPLTGDFYILIVPLLGIFGTILVISGIIVWIKLYARKNH
jgi:hypothetical protein